MPTLPAVITPPARLPKKPFVTEAQLAHLLRVTPETLRAWRRRGEMPAVAVGPARDEFCRGLKVHGRWPVCYRIEEVSAWLWGSSADGRPPALPASAWDAANDQTMQLRRAGQAAKNAGDVKSEARIRRQLTSRAKFAVRLGFASPTEYEDWVARGSPEGELPAAVQANREAALRDPVEPEEPEQHLTPPPPPAPLRVPVRPPSPWEVMGAPDDDDDALFDPFAANRRSVPRRPSGYFS